MLPLTALRTQIKWILAVFIVVFTASVGFMYGTGGSRSNNERSGDFVVALYEGKNNLKQFIKENGRYILRSCNDDKESYPDIYPEDLQIQGVAVCVTHKLI